MNVTLRQIALACGVSTATVSRALSKKGYVRAGLRVRIREEAEQLGYSTNPLVGSLMGHVRRARTQQFIGNLAIVHIPSKQHAHIGPQERRILKSAQRRSEELGFSMEILELLPTDRGEAAFLRMMDARGVAGVIFVYPEPNSAPNIFDWHRFSVLAIDLARPEPRLHTVCHDHYVSLTSSLAYLRNGGYRRAGMFIEEYKDARTNYKWTAAFTTFQTQRGGIGHLPVLNKERMDEKAFGKWYLEHSPDVVIGHFDDAISWLERMKRFVPKDLGFFNLNWLGRNRPCAGIDPHLEQQGHVAADLLIAAVQRGELGLPAVPRQILVPGRFVPGPSLFGLSNL